MRFFGAKMFSCVLPRAALCVAPLLQQSISACGKHEDVTRYKLEAERTTQMKQAAVAWCKAEGKNGYAASHRKGEDDDWLWPLVTEGSVNRRLSGAVDVERPWQAHSVLTPEEEADLVETCKELNLFGQGVDREQMGKMVLDSLLLRPALNAGRDYTGLARLGKLRTSCCSQFD